MDMRRRCQVAPTTRVRDARPHPVAHEGSHMMVSRTMPREEQTMQAALQGRGHQHRHEPPREEGRPQPRTTEADTAPASDGVRDISARCARVCA